MLAKKLILCTAIASAFFFVVYHHQTCQAQAVPVAMKKTAQGWQMLRDGKPYYVKGAGGDGPMELLAAMGGNSIRTWGIDENTKSLLDQAHANGLTVALGIWLEHVRKGFDYDNEEACKSQMESVLATVEKYKDHPAVLVWGIGNELENGCADNLAIWKQIDCIAAKIKKADPHHPVMTVIAELGDNKVELAHKHCPNLDLIGLNSYAGATSLVKRYRELGGTKPILVTEFGPFGTWESPKDENGSVIEQTSGEKAKSYLNSYKSFTTDKNICLGSYAFLWGNKQEGTASWYGMLLADGSRTAAADELSKAWTGKAVANRCPSIDEIEISSNKLKPGEKFSAKLTVNDPESDPIKTDWIVMQEAERTIAGGDFQAFPPVYPQSVISSKYNKASFRAPQYAGLYRVYAVARDSEKGAATANMRFRVMPAEKLPSKARTGESVKLPFLLPAGNKGIQINASDKFKLDLKSTTSPKFGSECIKVEFSGTKSNDSLHSIVWQQAKPVAAYDLTGATKLTFWARGVLSGEKLKFGIGSPDALKKDASTAKKEMGFSLGNVWTKYEMDLSNLDLRRVEDAFYMTIVDADRPMTCYIDGITFEK